MEADEENNGNINLKRQRAPLSDSEDNVCSSEVNDGQKRRRLEASGRENRSPKPSSSGRLAELRTKPDTPIVPSVRFRVQQLTRTQDGEAPLAQRCLSDPGADSPSVFHEKGCRQHLLGEREFHQRLERFKVPVFQASPALTPSPTNSCPRTCSNFVSDIQQKLQCPTTPSSQQASRMREERKQELSQLQPISENAWLKRSNSDPMLSQGRTPPGPSSPSWIPRSRRRVHWPPTQPWDADGDAEMKDGSFTEVLTSGAEKHSSDARGEKTPCDSETPAASVEPDNSNEGQLQMEWKDQNCHQGEEVRDEKEHMASIGNEEKQLMYQQSQTQAVLKLSFSGDQSFSREPYRDDQNMSELPTGDEQSFLESTHQEESNVKETVDVSKVTEQGSSEVISYEEVDETDSHSYSVEEIEPSTDEEFRLWRYPRDQVSKEGESLAAEEQEEGLCAKVAERNLESSRVEKEQGGSVTGGCELSDFQDGECYLGDVSAVTAGSSEMQESEKPRPEDDGVESESFLDVSVKDQPKEILTVNIKEDMDLESDRQDPCSAVKQTEASPFAEVLNQSQTENTDLQMNIAYGARPKVEIHVELSDMDGNAGAQCLTEEVEHDAVDKSQRVHGPTEETHKAEGGESSKKVSFILEPELINDSIQSEINTSTESRAETRMSDAEQSSHDETNTAEIIDQMFEEVLDYAGRIEEERVHNDEDTEDHDSGIGACSGDKDKMDTEFEKEKSEEEREAKEDECDESNGDELLTFPSSGILSPLSKSVEAVVTPLRLAVSQESNPPSLLLTPEETSTPPAESAPLYSVDAYRTQRQSKQSIIQSVTRAVQRQAPQKTRPQPSVNIKERITTLNEEAGKLQSVINQTLQALSCCTDEEHGRGSLEEAEAEKLLLVSCEKRSALLAEVTRLREERTSEAAEEEGVCVSQLPCRGTVSISNIQLPLKVEFVCSSHNRTGRPSHYFFILIRYGPCNIVATPLATAADAQNGDTISFPTSVTLKDICSAFEIDVEVYSLSHTSGGNCSMDRTTTKSRVTPRKLLNTITRSNNSLTSAAPALNTRRSSNFSLVGSHKITLASLGHGKFPLDKMKLEGKIRRLLGDEFQEKVPFLSPLEGNIYLRLDSQSHSNVQHQGFLTMFELISGYGVWHRRYFVLEGCIMYHWNHPNDKETKEAEGSISLSGSTSRCVRPVKRDSCARPFTFELVSNIPPQQQDDTQEALAKCWFSADTKQERLDWMEKLNQALLDFHTWNGSSATQTESQSNTSSSGNLRESIL